MLCAARSVKPSQDNSEENATDINSEFRKGGEGKEDASRRLTDGHTDAEVQTLATREAPAERLHVALG
jgi:hypothetical protein